MTVELVALAERCETCRFGLHFPAIMPPQPEEYTPYRPKWWQAIFGPPAPRRDELTPEEWVWLFTPAKTVCQRFPREVRKAPDDICGEYRARASLASNDTQGGVE